MAAAHRLLDLTRLVSRVGRGPLTGVDRVEAAYLDRFLADPVPAWFLVSTRRHAILLDMPAAAAFRERLAGRAFWGPPDLIGRLALRLPRDRRLAEASLRREAVAKVVPERLVALLTQHLGANTEYYNTGHGNLSAKSLTALGQITGLRRNVLIHDTIPLDHPEFSRPGTAGGFAAKLRATGALADRVIYVSSATQARAERHFAALGRVPPGLTAPIGVGLATPDPAALPPDLQTVRKQERPYFVTLGTIEPRKNHALLLDVWQTFHETLPEAETPRLVILGGRGWQNEEVFQRLDTAPFMGRTVIERAGLSDGAVSALVERAAGLLFPSRAEGFGLPPHEAAALGTPVVVAPLPAYRETLGDLPVYAAPDDRYLWAQIIRRLAEVGTRAGRSGAARPAYAPPTWQAHFKAVLTNP